MTVNKAAEQYSIPRSTVSSRLRKEGWYAQENTPVDLPMASQIETEVVIWLKTMESISCCSVGSALAPIIREVAEMFGEHSMFPMNNLPSARYCSHFLSQQSGLNFDSNGSIQFEMHTWLNKLKLLLKRNYKLDADTFLSGQIDSIKQIYCCHQVASLVKNEDTNGTQLVYRCMVSNQERQRMLTLYSCVQADGTALQPLVLAKTRAAERKYLKVCNNANIVWSKEASMESDTLLDWLQIIVNEVGDSVQKPLLVFLDQSIQHISLATLDFCQMNIIILFYLPKCSVFSGSSSFGLQMFLELSKQCDYLMDTKSKRVSSTEASIAMLIDAWLNTSNDVAVRAEFNTLGLVPLNEDHLETNTTLLLVSSLMETLSEDSDHTTPSSSRHMTSLSESQTSLTDPTTQLLEDVNVTDKNCALPPVKKKKRVKKSDTTAIPSVNIRNDKTFLDSSTNSKDSMKSNLRSPKPKTPKSKLKRNKKTHELHRNNPKAVQNFFCKAKVLDREDVGKSSKAILEGTSGTTPIIQTVSNDDSNKSSLIQNLSNKLKRKNTDTLVSCSKSIGSIIGLQPVPSTPRTKKSKLSLPLKSDISDDKNDCVSVIGKISLDSDDTKLVIKADDEDEASKISKIDFSPSTVVRNPRQLLNSPEISVPAFTQPIQESVLMPPPAVFCPNTVQQITLLKLNCDGCRKLREEGRRDGIKQGICVALKNIEACMSSDLLKLYKKRYITFAGNAARTIQRKVTFKTNNLNSFDFETQCIPVEETSTKIYNNNNLKNTVERKPSSLGLEINTDSGLSKNSADIHADVDQFVNEPTYVMWLELKRCLDSDIGSILQSTEYNDAIGSVYESGETHICSNLHNCDSNFAKFMHCNDHKPTNSLHIRNQQQDYNNFSSCQRKNLLQRLEKINNIPCVRSNVIQSKLETKYANYANPSDTLFCNQPKDYGISNSDIANADSRHSRYSDSKLESFASIFGSHRGSCLKNNDVIDNPNRDNEIYSPLCDTDSRVFNSRISNSSDQNTVPVLHDQINLSTAHHAQQLPQIEQQKCQVNCTQIQNSPKLEYSITETNQPLQNCNSEVGFPLRMSYNSPVTTDMKRSDQQKTSRASSNMGVPLMFPTSSDNYDVDPSDSTSTTITKFPYRSHNYVMSQSNYEKAHMNSSVDCGHSTDGTVSNVERVYSSQASSSHELPTNNASSKYIPSLFHSNKAPSYESSQFTVNSYPGYSLANQNCVNSIQLPQRSMHHGSYPNESLSINNVALQHSNINVAHQNALSALDGINNVQNVIVEGSDIIQNEQPYQYNNANSSNFDENMQNDSTDIRSFDFQECSKQGGKQTNLINHDNINEVLGLSSTESLSSCGPNLLKKIVDESLANHKSSVCATSSFQSFSPTVTSSQRPIHDDRLPITVSSNTLSKLIPSNTVSSESCANESSALENSSNSVSPNNIVDISCNDVAMPQCMNRCPGDFQQGSVYVNTPTISNLSYSENTVKLQTIVNENISQCNSSVVSSNISSNGTSVGYFSNDSINNLSALAHISPGKFSANLDNNNHVHGNGETSFSEQCEFASKSGNNNVVTEGSPLSTTTNNCHSQMIYEQQQHILQLQKQLQQNQKQQQQLLKRSKLRKQREGNQSSKNVQILHENPTHPTGKMPSQDKQKHRQEQVLVSSGLRENQYELTTETQQQECKFNSTEPIVKEQNLDILQRKGECQETEHMQDSPSTDGNSDELVIDESTGL